MRRWFPPVVTAGFVMAGFFKGTSAFEFLPFDLTLLLAVLVAVAVLVRLVGSTIPTTVPVVIAGFALLLPAAFAVYATDYGTDKVARLFTITLLAVLAPIILIRDLDDARRHLWVLTALCGVIVASALLDPQESGTYAGAPVTVEGNDTIALGDAAGVVVVVMVMGLLWRRVPWPVAVPVGGAAVFALLQSGSRGPLFAVVLAVAVGALLVRARPSLVRSAVVAALVGVGLIVAFGAAPYYSRQRIDELLVGQVTGTTNVRVQLYDVAWRSVLDDPLGLGLGGFQKVAFLGYRYPHDLFLEVLAEAGVIFGGLFLLWILFCLWRAHRGTGTFAGATAFAMTIFMLATAAVSGDLNDNRAFFYVLGIALAVAGVASAPHEQSEPADERERTPPVGDIRTPGTSS